MNIHLPGASTVPAALAVVGFLVVNGPAAAAKNPIEIGTVEWGRDLDGAIKKSSRSGKPVFAFFQEVPGCAGCQEFGSTVMSDPLLVEAVEREFLPVLIYNNRKGKDAEILKRYEEPAWNYQVIRFLDGSGKDLIPRKDRVWTRDALALRMTEALESAGRPVPHYLEVTAYESDPERQETIAFAQSCFWSGEVALGQVPGVIATEAGWMEGREVTLVRYRPDLVTLDALIEQAVAANVSDKIYVPTLEQRKIVDHDGSLKVAALDESYRRADDEDQKRQIGESVFAELDLSDMQRTKVNAFASVDMQKAFAWLTPAQLEEFERLRNKR